MVSPALDVPGSRWRLVGPWYRWPHPALPSDGRTARPAIQKFAGNDFLTGFLARPQHSLKYDATIDVVAEHDLVSAKALSGKVATLFALNSKGNPAAAGEPNKYRARLAPTGLRKLYQPTHDRHYLAVCELHCDEPGFPRVDRRRVCQAGFVVRRRRSIVPPGVTQGDIETQAAIVRKAEAERYELDVLAFTASDLALSEGLRAAARKRQDDLALAVVPATWQRLLEVSDADLAAKRAALQAWYQAAGVAVQLEGWFPRVSGAASASSRGRWQPLAAAQQGGDPSQSREQTYPLFAVVPDPRETVHDASGRNLYYGVVPTGDLQHDDEGKPHFDDLATYELACFVRAHHPCPPRTGKTPDCHGHVSWSASSEAFRVAAPFDILGSANRPVTIKMPDLRDLAAQAALRPRGKLSPVRFVQPQHLAPKVSGGQAGKSDAGGEAICSFSIPLITIIALFLLNLFLPIVVFIFQLWFLLVFRFCIPPQLKASIGVDAALAATPPGVDLDLDFAVSIGGVAQTAAQLNALLAAGMQSKIGEDTGSSDTPDLSGLANGALGVLDQSFIDAAALVPSSDGGLPAPPEVGTVLVYEDPVVPVWSAQGAIR